MPQVKIIASRNVGYEISEILFTSGLSCVLVRNPAKMRHPVKGLVEADYRLSVIPTETSNPVVVFAEPGSHPAHFSIHVGSGFRNTVVESIDGPSSEIVPRSVRSSKR